MKVGRWGVRKCGALSRPHGGEYGIYPEPRLKKVIRKKTGVWTVDELVETMPKTLLKGYTSKSGSAE